MKKLKGMYAIYTQNIEGVKKEFSGEVIKFDNREKGDLKYLFRNESNVTTWATRDELHLIDETSNKEVFNKLVLSAMVVYLIVCVLKSMHL